jgi:16S rRNA (cytosine1402-N4)-methyltransferase
MESSSNREKIHNTVLVPQVLEFLAPLKNARIIDATLGSAGHTLALVKEGAHVLGIEADSQMLEIAARRLEEACPTPNQDGWGSFKVVHGNFRDLDEIASKAGFDEVDGVLFDLGVSNIQLTSPARGFSFSNPEAPLDMRIDPKTQGVTGADLLNGLREDQLISLFGLVLDRGPSKWLTKRTISVRSDSPIKSVGDFLRVCEGLRTKSSLHEATLPFLALRMAVNSERENLEETLPQAFNLLKKDGKLLMMTFHSGEEKIVLDFYHKRKRNNKGKILTEKPKIPGQEEVRANPRARSVELWVLQKL